MPDLNPIVTRLDELIRDTHSDLQFAVTWKKAYYGLPDVGWMMGDGRVRRFRERRVLRRRRLRPATALGDADGSRYIKLKAIAEIEQPQLKAWIEQAGCVPGWKK